LAKKSKNSKNHKPESSHQRLLATNPNAKRNYFIEDIIEAGVQLQGTEVKSLRDQSPTIDDAYVEIKNTSGSIQAYLINAAINPYRHGTAWNHDLKRKRKLLLHRNEIDRLFGAIHQKGFTIIPTKIYFKKGVVKVQIGLGKPKKIHDKRDDLKRKTADREMAAALKRSQR